MLKAYEILKSHGLVVHVSNLGFQKNNFHEDGKLDITANKSYDDLGRTDNVRHSLQHKLDSETTVPITQPIRAVDVSSKGNLIGDTKRQKAFLHKEGYLSRVGDRDVEEVA